MEVTLLDHMGDDQTVVNAARCSFGKRIKGVDFFEVEYDNKTKTMTSLCNSDEKLVRYLAKHNHWTPFGHCSVQFHIKAPMFVARQLGKHQVGLVWNEISRRYVDTDPEFYLVDEWRLRAKNIKQGSSDETVNYTPFSHASALSEYKTLLDLGVAPEMARMVLPQNTMTEWYWSGSLYAFSRICRLRLANDSQKETREVAQLISEWCGKLFPVSWKYLVKPVSEPKSSAAKNELDKIKDYRKRTLDEISKLEKELSTGSGISHLQQTSGELDETREYLKFIDDQIKSFEYVLSLE